MISDRQYYRDELRRTFRIVQQLTDSTFVVVKVFEGRIRTVKFWLGDIDECERHWRTKRFEPSLQAKHMLDTEFDCTIQEFGPAFQIALSCSA